MLRSVDLGRRLLSNFRRLQLQKRTFLSEEYACEEEWKKRFNSKTLQTVKPSYLSMVIEQRYRTEKLISAVDVDVFANAITDDHNAPEMLTFVRYLRLTKEAFNILDSTHQAVIMFLLSHNFRKELLHILHDRLTYGIFPNLYNYNFLMDLFVVENQFANAAKVAVLPMLQDDEGNLITKTLALYSCYKYLENPAEWKVEVEEDDGEEVKIRIRYLRNPYHDDHFDIKEPVVLVGKTLAFFGKLFNDAIGRSCQLRGLILYKKYKKALNLLLDWKKTVEKDLIYLEAKKHIMDDIKNIPEEQQDDDVKQLTMELEKLEDSNLLADSLINAMENNVKNAVEEHSAADIEAQKQNFKSWEQTRETLLHEQVAKLSKEKRLKHIEELKEKLHEKERFLTFFNNEEQIELKIEENEEKYKKLYDSVATNPRKLKLLKMVEAREKSESASEN